MFFYLTDSDTSTIQCNEKSKAKFSKNHVINPQIAEHTKTTQSSVAFQTELCMHNNWKNQVNGMMSALWLIEHVWGEEKKHSFKKTTKQFSQNKLKLQV